MAKIVLDTVTGGYDLSVINNNFDKIETEFQNKVLYRDNPAGEANTLQSDMDVNGKAIYNLPEPLLDSQAARLQDVQNALAGGAANLIAFTPYSTISSTNIQAAVQEFVDEVASNGAVLDTFLKDKNSIEVDTVAALRLVDKTKYTKAQVFGYYVKGDGAFGTYWFDSGDIISSDNGGSVIVAADGGRWKLLHSGRLNVKNFGAKGDGVTDDTAFIQAADNAANSQGAIVFFPRSVYISEALTSSVKWIGEGRDLSIIRKKASAPASNFISPSSTTLFLSNLGIDGNKSVAVSGNNNIFIPNTVTEFVLDNLDVRNAKTASGWGGGIVIQGSSINAGSSITNCIVISNDATGVSIENANNVTIHNNTISSNGGDGLSVNNYDQTFTQKLFNIRITSNIFQSNTSNGLVVANFIQDNNQVTPVYGISNPEGQYIIVANNNANQNGFYGLSISGYNIIAEGNVTLSNAVSSVNISNILFNATYSLLSNNICETSNGAGIDAGGAQFSSIISNIIHGNATVGLNLESNSFIHVADNILKENDSTSGGIQLLVDRFGGASETQGFTTPGQNITIQNNRIFIDNTRVGIKIVNNPASVTVMGNTFSCSSPATDVFRCVQAFGTSIKISGNKLNGVGFTGLTPTGGGVLEVPDIQEFAVLDSATTIGALQTSSSVAVGTGIAYCSITAGGSGYTSVPTVAFSGGGPGTGAAATAIISASGVVTGIRVTAFGSGYTSSPTVTISGGGGVGATATAQFKLGIPEERELELLFLTGETITRAGTITVENPAAADIVVPIRGSVKLRGAFSQWYMIAKNF